MTDFISFSTNIDGVTSEIKAGNTLLLSATTTAVTFAANASASLDIGNAAVAAAFPGGISIPTGKDVTGAGTATVTGFATVSATTLTGTLSTAAQPNVTSLGTLTGLTSSGAISGTSLSSTAGSSPTATTNQVHAWVTGGTPVIDWVDGARTANNRKAEFFFTGGNFRGAFANDANNASTDWLSVAGGYAAGTTSITLTGATTVSGSLTAGAISGTTGTFSGAITSTSASPHLLLGGSTASFPAIGHSGTTVLVRLADNSDYAPLQCAGFTSNTAKVIALAGFGTGYVKVGNDGVVFWSAT